MVKFLACLLLICKVAWFRQEKKYIYIATATFALLRLFLYFSIKINEFNSFRYICVCLGLVDLFPTEIGLEGAYRNRIGRSFSIKECGLVIIILILLVKIVY